MLLPITDYYTGLMLVPISDYYYYTQYTGLMLVPISNYCTTVQCTGLMLVLISDYSRSDAGTYICTADNGVGPPVTATISLNVICKYQEE